MKEYFRLVRLLKPYAGLLILSILLIILFSLANAVSVYLSIPLLKTLFSENPAADLLSNTGSANIFNSFREVIDSYIFTAGDKYSSLLRVCYLLMISYFLKNVFYYIQSLLTQYAEKSMITDIRRKLFRKFNSLSLNYLSEKKSGDIISRLTNDVNHLQNTISVTFTNLFKEPVTIAIFLAMAFFLSWKLSLVSIVIIPLSMILIIKIGRKLRKYSIRLQEKLSEFTSSVSETIYAGKIIRAFSAEEFENHRFDLKLKEYFRTIMKTAAYSNLTSPLTEYISVLIGVFILWYGGREIIFAHSLNAEEFIGFLIIVFQLMPPIKNFSQVNNKIQEASAAAKRVFEILDLETGIIDSQGAFEKDTFNEYIEYRNVSFRYENGFKPVLDNVSLNIRKNEKIAIVGLSGVGKSTLVDLLPRFYDVTSGEIIIDGINIKDIRLPSLRNLFGIVTQEILLFNDTIRNNIAYGLDNPDKEKVTESAIKANAHDFIIRTEKGYDTIIGDRGVRLSGGQKQRIAIARALLRNAPIMIFDEATSSLDTESEKLIQQAIENLTLNHTSLIIAHRLSTIRNADRIIVLHEGKIHNVGTHDELIADDSGIYKKLYEMQFSW